METNDALLGKDGWTFYKGKNSIDNYQGINLYTDEELENLKQVLIERNEWFEKQGIEYYIFIPPDKHRVYGEYYPNYIKKVSDNSKLKQVKEALKGTDVKLVAPYEQIISKKEQGILYYKRDTHWDNLGAYYGYCSLMEEISKEFPKIKMLDIDDFEIQYTGYDLNEQGKTLKYKPDEDLNYPNLIKIKPYDYETILDDIYVEGIKTVNKDKDLKVIMFRDSFTSAMLPFISETFGSVEYLWYKQINKEQDKIIQEKPDIVIEEYVERNIDSFNYITPKLQEVE